MINAIKIILMLSIILLLSYPFICLKGKLKKFSIAASLKYESPHMRKNVFFVLLMLLEYLVVFLLFKLFDKLSQLIVSIPFFGRLIVNAVDGLNSQVDYIILAIKMVLINLLLIYVFIFLKAVLKKFVINPLYKIGPKRDVASLLKIFKGKKNKAKKNKKKKKDGEEDSDEEQTPENEEETEEEKIRRRRRIPDFVHTLLQEDGEPVSEEENGEEDGDDTDSEEKEKKKKKVEYGRFSSLVFSWFFEGDEFQYAKDWVIRARTVLQIFVYLVEAFYLVFLTSILLSVFFALPMPIYNLLINVLHVGDWYLYPVVSIVLLQEICNVFNTPVQEDKLPEQTKGEVEEKKKEKKTEARVRALLAELKRRFDAEHSLRYYPEVSSKEMPKYKCTNLAYSSSLEYIGKMMETSSGRVVQSYMECLDAVFCDSHVYFAASFYSELGEYLIAYTYTRLLSGARLVYVVSDPEEKETLRTYISDRLMQMTGSSATATWRVYTAEERLDQADVFIASPSDFSKANITERHPAFFEEVSNAIFIDSDKNISLDSYLCPIMATRLQKATNNRIRFIFLSMDLLKGFAQRNLPKFFCVENVLSFSSAKENEAVSYVLWNKESKKRRIYNKSGQKLTCLETIIAEQAHQYGMDGIRLITEAPLGHSEKQILALHGIEINKLFKKNVDVNYMIFSDDHCNLSAALYACTRFRGRRKSIVHILSKPYFLREYFMSKANIEDYINRSSFIQPRVTEHVDEHKFALLKIFCEAAAEGGISLALFEEKMRALIIAQREQKLPVLSAFCREILRQEKDINKIKTAKLAEYLIAGLCDNDPVNLTDDEERAYILKSVGNRAKDFYLILDPERNNRYALFQEKKILFSRSREVFDRLLEINNRVELRLNGEVIGLLDTFPSRVSLEYIAGQSIVYNNYEYEIDHVASDGSAIYLRHENISIKNCLDTVLLRHYQINGIKLEGVSGVLNNSKSLLEEIRVSKCELDYVGTTFGFYSITNDRQTLDFERGVEGNPHVACPNVRALEEGKALHVSLKARMECNDGMRMLMSAAFNEFIRTIFPHAYHCIAICPILEKPYSFEGEDLEDTTINRIRTLYPFLKNPDERFIETESNRMQFLFINDCADDVGALDWFYDRAGRYMQEFLANVYSYLHWLKSRPDKNHYIYYGGTELPKCFDLDGCCELLSDFNLVLSDDGKKDFETAGDDAIDELLYHCSFCHRPMESGRFSFFDKHRYICADCFDIVDDLDRLDELYISAREYLVSQYPDITFGSATVAFDPVYDLPLDKILSEYNHRVDFIERKIFVEVDEPVNNVSVALIRGIIALWQTDSSVANHYSAAQLYFEELKYLYKKSEDVTADWIYANLPADVRAMVDEIVAYVNFKDSEAASDENSAEDETPAQASEGQDTDEAGNESGAEALTEAEEATDDDDSTDSDKSTDAEEPTDAEESTDAKEESRALRDGFMTSGYRGNERRTSFSFMRLKAAEDKDEEWDDDGIDDDNVSDALYDPNKIPRFWKRYLRGERADNGKEDEIDEDAVIDKDEDEMHDEPLAPNAPFGSEEENTDGVADESDKKALTKEEKKRLREEKRRQRQLEWEQSLDAIDKEENKKKGRSVGNNTDEPNDSEGAEKKKRRFSLFGKKKSASESIPTDGEDKDEEKLTEDGDKTDLDNVTDSDDLGAERDDVENGDSDGAVDDNKDNGKDGKDGSSSNKGKNTDKKKKKPARIGRGSVGERMVPYEDDEKTNPRIRLYNELVRAAYNYEEGEAHKISYEGVSQDEMKRVFRYVQGDYPELFWVSGLVWNSTHVWHKFRCRTANGAFDVKQVNKKRAEIRKGAKPFIKGITRKTDPYQAALTIYRRLILTLDYDTVGLNANVDQDESRDDALRSLYNALVNHKVVCAGYAVAMQYLLQSVGIVSGYVVSEDDHTKTSCHAFNVLRLGKYCYYLDATWGDRSDTSRKGGKNDVKYDYFCVPYSEFTLANPESVPYHIPRKEYYPNLEEFKYTNHEYYRYHNAYIKSYNESDLVRIFADAAKAYDEKEMGRFAVSFRCSNTALMQHIEGRLDANGKLFDIIAKARASVKATDKKAAKLLEVKSACKTADPYTGVVRYTFGSED